MFSRTDMQLRTCVFGVVYAFSRIFSPFSLCKRYYIVQYRRNKYVFMPSQRAAAVLLFCAVVVDLSVLQRMFEVFPFTFSRVTVLYSLGASLRNCAILTPNSRICVALLVSAPFIVA